MKSELCIFICPIRSLFSPAHHLHLDEGYWFRSSSVLLLAQLAAAVATAMPAVAAVGGDDGDAAAAGAGAAAAADVADRTRRWQVLLRVSLTRQEPPSFQFEPSVGTLSSGSSGPAGSCVCCPGRRSRWESFPRRRAEAAPRDRTLWPARCGTAEADRLELPDYNSYLN